MRSISEAVLIKVFVILVLIAPHVSAQTPFNVLVFSKTNGFRHASISEGQKALKDLGSTYGFTVETTEDSSLFTPSYLFKFEVVVFLNTTGEILGPQEQLAFENYIENGGGFVGIHSASDTEYDWPWYGQLVGSYFNGHPAIQSATLTTEDQTHVSTQLLPGQWTKTDEWYNFIMPFPTHLNVLVTVDESTYSGGNMGNVHPISWYHEVGKGRSFYTALGHTAATYSEKDFLNHITGALFWASHQNLSDHPLSSQSDLQVYPNPNPGVIKIRSGNDSNTLHLKLVNSLGKTVWEEEGISAQYDLDVNHLPAGIYILNMKQSGQWKQLKIQIY